VAQCSTYFVLSVLINYPCTRTAPLPRIIELALYMCRHNVLLVVLNINFRIRPFSIIIIIIIIIIIVISFMQGIYTYIPKTNCVPKEYSVAAILLVLISLVSVLNLLYFYISTFRSMCAVPNMAVFWSSLTTWFPGMLPTYFLNDIIYYYYFYYYYVTHLYLAHDHVCYHPSYFTGCLKCVTTAVFFFFFFILSH